MLMGWLPDRLASVSQLAFCTIIDLICVHVTPECYNLQRLKWCEHVETNSVCVCVCASGRLSARSRANLPSLLAHRRSLSPPGCCGFITVGFMFWFFTVGCFCGSCLLDGFQLTCFQSARGEIQLI